MNLRDNPSKALWMEKSDLEWETDLSPYELDMLELDERPSRTLTPPPVATARRVPAVTPGVAPADNSLPVGGPTTVRRSAHDEEQAGPPQRTAPDPVTVRSSLLPSREDRS